MSWQPNVTRHLVAGFDILQLLPQIRGLLELFSTTAHFALQTVLRYKTGKLVFQFLQFVIDPLADRVAFDPLYSGRQPVPIASCNV